MSLQVKMVDLEQRCESQTAEQGKLLEELEALKIKAEKTQNEHLKAMEQLKVSFYYLDRLKRRAFVAPIKHTPLFRILKTM